MLDIAAHTPLAPLTTLEVGGAARYSVRVADLDSLQEALAWARQQGLPTFVLGGGSNLLVADHGFCGLVIRMDGTTVRLDAASGHVHATAGGSWDHLVRDCVAAKLAGVECLSGIPGSNGAAPLQNIGAYGQEVGDTLTAVHAVARETGEACVLPASACGLAYRDSHFRSAWREQYVIVAIELQLTPGGAPTLRYPELQRSVPDNAPLATVRDHVLALRRSKSMVYDRQDDNHRSAGSFFTNPHVTGAVADALSARHPSMPRFAGPEGSVKLSAGWLIEQAGLPRGTVQGRVGLSSRHALAVINRGGATAAEVVDFALHVQDRVQQAHGVMLQTEPVLLGFDDATVNTLRGAQTAAAPRKA